MTVMFFFFQNVQNLMKISEMQQKIQNLEKKICFLGDGI